jgi:phage terminase large subunit-like protein
VTQDDLNKSILKWKRDPVSFVREVLREPRSGKPYNLFPEQKRFIREAFTLTPAGRLPYATAVYSTPKKNGKSTTGAWLAIYCATVIGGPYAAVYILANDQDQSAGVIFEIAKRIIEASPSLRSSANITATRIEFPSSGAFIQAVAHDYAGLAGIEPTLVVIDELWAFTSERSQRLYDEAVPIATIKVSGRLICTYAGFSNESLLLEKVYQRGLEGTEIAPALYAQPGLLMFWTHQQINRSPDTLQWAEDQKRDARPSAYTRQVLNQWVSSESKFIDGEMYDRCVDPLARPCLIDQSLTVFAGLDASLRHDTSALVGVTYDWKEKRVRVVAHKLFRPHGRDIDFGEVQKAVLDFRSHFALVSVAFDPWQLQAIAQILRTHGIPMVELNQTSGNLTAAADLLFELFQHRNIALYPDPDVREAVLNASIKEAASGRGFRLAKERPSKKIDLCAALSFACLTAIREYGGHEERYEYTAANSYIGGGELRQVNGAWVTTGPKDSCVERDRAEDFRGSGGWSSFAGSAARGFNRRGTW